VDSKGLVLGKRHVIVLSSWAEGEGANAELVRLVKSSHARVDIVSSVPNPVLQDFCRQVDGGFQQAQSDHEIAGALELIYLNLLPRYEVSYQPVSAEAQSLRVRLFGPSCWGETSIPIPPRPPGISACL